MLHLRCSGCGAAEGDRCLPTCHVHKMRADGLKAQGYAECKCGAWLAPGPNSWCYLCKTFYQVGVDLAGNSNQPCPDCKGTGKYVGLMASEPCKACKGTGSKAVQGSEEQDQLQRPQTHPMHAGPSPIANKPPPPPLMPADDFPFLKRMFATPTTNCERCGKKQVGPGCSYCKLENTLKDIYPHLYHED